VANILCLDFDGIIVPGDIARQIFDRFAESGWDELESRKMRGGLTPEQYRAAVLGLVESEKAELAEFVAAVALPRPGLAGVLGLAQWQGWVPMVVSPGFDFYVDPVLDVMGMDRLARHVGRTRRDYRWRVRYESPRGVELEDGFVLSYLSALRNAGDFVVYASVDEDAAIAAAAASMVFAGGGLLKRLEGAHERVHPFEGFEELWRVIESECPAGG